MNILVLSGSPRRNGNTEALVSSFCEGAKDNNNVEVLSIRDIKVNPCIGCNTCFERKGNFCFQKDDMQIVYDKLMNADVLVIASPVYFYGISAQLKAVIDRIHTPMRNNFKIKKLALICVAGATIPELFNPIKIQYKLILNYFKLEDLGAILVSGVRNMGDIKNHPSLTKAYALGKSIK